MTDGKNDLMDYLKSLDDKDVAAFAAFVASRASGDDPAPGVRQYIGARYVPVFANPLEWTDTRGYEPLTIVTHQGNSYTSMQSVPTGIDIANTDYWALTGNYNAQIDAYRAEVQAFDQRIADNAEAAADALAEVAAETAARKAAITAEATARASADEELANRINEAVEKVPYLTNERGRSAVFIGDSFMAPSTSYPQKLAYFVCQLTGWDMYNYAVGGTGWVDAGGVGMTFQNQLDKAAQEISIPTSNVDYVIIGGGFNDWNESPQLTYNQLYSAALATLQKAAALFPNAKIVCIPMMFRNWGVDAHMHNLYSAICSGLCAANKPFQLITDAYMWQLAFKNVDGVHPTVELYKIMAQYVVSKVFGGDVKVDRLYTLPFNNANVNGTLTFMNMGGVVSCSIGNISVTNMAAGSSVQIASKVPLFAASLATQRVPVLNASGVHVGQVVFSGSAVLYVSHIAVTSSTTYNGGSVTYPLWVKNPQ